MEFSESLQGLTPCLSETVKWALRNGRSDTRSGGREFNGHVYGSGALSVCGHCFKLQKLECENWCYLGILIGSRVGWLRATKPTIKVSSFAFR